MCQAVNELFADEIAELKKQVADKDVQLADKDAQLADSATLIANLQAELLKYQQSTLAN